MKLKFWQTPKFKELHSQWNKKLIQDGFEDAEISINGRVVLKQRATNCYRGVPEVQRENKLRYYELLSAGTSIEKFTDPVEALVLRRKSDGVKIKDICIELRNLNQRCHRETVSLIIRKYEVKWGIKK